MAMTIEEFCEKYTIVSASKITTGCPEGVRIDFSEVVNHRAVYDFALCGDYVLHGSVVDNGNGTVAWLWDGLYNGRRNPFDSTWLLRVEAKKPS